jgi:hypothetical protein
MVERIDPVPVLSNRPAATLPTQGGSVLSLPSGEIAADLRRIGGTRHQAAYELRVVNGSHEAIAAYTYALPVPAGARVWQGALVPALSSLAVMVYVPQSARRGTAPLVAELHAAGTRLTIGAPPVSKRGRPAAKRAVAALTLAVLIAAFAWGANGAANRFAGGSTAAPRVSVRFVPLESALRQSHRLRAILPPLRIEKLHAPGSARSGQSVRIDYRTAGNAGTVALVDEFGKTLARTELDAGGSSVLMVPNVGAAQDINVVVAARRGSERSSASAPLFVRPAERRAPQPQTRATVPPLPTAAPAAPAELGQLSVEADTLTGPVDVTPVQSVGRPIVVRVLAHPHALHVSLFGVGGTPVAERDVPLGAQRVVFPALSKPRDLSLIATYTRGSGEESTISTLSVR